MARVRPGRDADFEPPTRGPEGTRLYSLLTSRRFRLGAGTERVAENLSRHGGFAAGDAAAWVGVTRPPPDAPSISLGPSPGTLGPGSYGFLNNVGGVAALDAPLPSLPRKGSMALIVPRRNALPDLGPLVVDRGLGVSFLISVGDGDPAEAIAFANADAATTCLLVALGVGARGTSLRTVLGAKPTIVLGGDPLCRAVARRAGAETVERLEDWLAHAALLDANIASKEALLVLVLGGGLDYVRGILADASIESEVTSIDDRQPEGLGPFLEQARAQSRALLVVAAGPLGPSILESIGSKDDLRLLTTDLRRPEHFAALVAALARRPTPEETSPSLPNVDQTLVSRVREQAEGKLSDHDAKRLLKAYGVRVTRQAPTSTPTGAVKLARTIGLPVVLLAGADERQAATFPEVRRLSSLLLQDQGEVPSVMVREHFPEIPRATVRVQVERGLGLTMRVGEACALLPLSHRDAQLLAQATLARRAADQRIVAELLLGISACALAERAAFQLELFVGADPAVLGADGRLAAD